MTEKNYEHVDTAFPLGEHWIAEFVVLKLTWLLLIFQFSWSEMSLTSRNICSNTPTTWLVLECNVPFTSSITWPWISHSYLIAPGIKFGRNFNLFSDWKLLRVCEISVELCASTVLVSCSLCNASIICESMKKCSGPIFEGSWSFIKE